MLSLLKARHIVDRAIRQAQQLGVSISVAVCDRSGRLVAFNQMDECRGWDSDRCAMGKAVAAAITGLPSELLNEHLQRYGLGLCSHSNVVPPRAQRGGVPVIDAHVVEGGCGVSGAPTMRQDEECARAGIAQRET